MMETLLIYTGLNLILVVKVTQSMKLFQKFFFAIINYQSYL